MADVEELPPGFEEHVRQMRGLANRRASPRLSGEQVRQRGTRRRRLRRSALFAGGTMTLTGAAVLVVLLAGASPGPSAVVAPAATHRPSAPVTRSAAATPKQSPAPAKPPAS